jgi:uncharacterized protein
MSALSKNMIFVALALVAAVSIFVLGSPTVEFRALEREFAQPETVVDSVGPARPASLGEDLDFDNATRAGSLEGWRWFLSAHPNGAYAQIAKAEMDRLAGDKAAAPTDAKVSNAAPNPEIAVSSVDPARAASLGEDLDFDNATRAGSLEGWRSFLSAHPSGVYAQIAKAEMERLAGEKAAAPTDVKASNAVPNPETVVSSVDPARAAAPIAAENSAVLIAVETSKAAPADEKTTDAPRRTDLAGNYEAAAAAYNRGEFAIAKRLWLPLAKQGDARAQLGLAVMYFLGQGVQLNMAAALEWCQKAADQGLAAAQYELGQIYEHPWRPELQDVREAAKWYRKAADQNFAKAQDELAAMYEFGLGVPTDYTKAEELFVKAGDLASVANMYDAVAHEPNKAANWRRRLAGKGDKRGNSPLVEMYGDRSASTGGNELVRK